MKKLKSSLYERVPYPTLRQLSAAMITTLMLSAPALADTQTIYKETYTFCTGTVLGAEAAGQAGWLGLVGGFPQAKVGNLKVFSYGKTEVGGSVNSNPVGLSQGYGFWFKPVYALTILSREFPFDVGLIKNSNARVQYAQRLSGVNLAGEANNTRIAFLIDNTWYISQEFSRQQMIGIWENVEVSPSSLTYGTVVPADGLGPMTPTVYNAPLPAAGTVRAFGVFLDEVNGRVRIDNFSIKTVLPSGSSISTNVQEQDVMQCPETSPDRTGDGGGQTPPNPDDGDTNPDQNVPDPVVPTPGPGDGGTSSVVYGFCPVKQQGTGVRVQLTRQGRAAILRKVKKSSSVNLRDRAIISILAQRAMPMGALVNMKVGDYNPQTGVLTVSARAGVKPLAIKLGNAQQAALQEYLASAGAPTNPIAPMFLSKGSLVKPAASPNALCIAEIKTMLRSRAAKAKIGIAGVTKPNKRR